MTIKRKIKAIGSLVTLHSIKLRRKMKSLCQWKRCLIRAAGSTC